MEKDHLFAQPMNVEDFIFDENVSRVFDDMVDRSVPGYRTLVANIGIIAGNFLQNNTYCYDLGCSHGACLFAVLRSNPDIKAFYTGVDQSQAMIDEARSRLDHFRDSADTIQLLCMDISQCELHSASVVILNLTLQFIEPSERDRLITNIYHALLPGGALILSEKLHFPNSTEEEFFDSLHQKFKQTSGYSTLEISQKRKSLERVLIKETEHEHLHRLHTTGFTDIYRWFQCYNFSSYIAIKK